MEGNLSTAKETITNLPRGEDLVEHRDILETEAGKKCYGHSSSRPQTSRSLVTASEMTLEDGGSNLLDRLSCRW
jgi:hypothetical protein